MRQVGTLKLLRLYTPQSIFYVLLILLPRKNNEVFDAYMQFNVRIYYVFDGQSATR